MNALGRLGLAVSLGCVVAAGGCAPPAGQQNNRVEVTDTTRAERNSRLVSTTELSEFRDQVAQELTADLKQVPELNEHRVTVILGDIENKTQIVATTDFEAFRSGLRAKLMNSRTVLQNIQFVENRAKLEELKRKEGNRGGDLLQERGGTARAPDRNEDYTFLLNGEMFRVARGGESVNYYGMVFNLMRLSDGAIVWSSSQYETKRVLK